MRILLCTNGSSQADRALELGARVAQSLASEVDVLVAARGDTEAAALHSAEAAVSRLESAGVSVALHRRTGRLAEEVVRQAQTVPYDLVIVGSRGRRGLVRLLFGSVALRIAEHVPASVLVIKGRARELRRFLVCSSAGPASERTVQVASRMARALDASATLLHVMSQLPLADSAAMDYLDASAEDLIERNSWEGAHLARMLALMSAEGVAARAVVRHGLVLDEIVAEAREGRYDVLVTGAHITPGLDARLVDNVCADILLAADRPVLVIR
jgi:nucleotide-binding universal stress UspA family protein